MKKYIIIIALMTVLPVAFHSCDKAELEELYPDPAKSSTATVENFFTGILNSANEVVLPWYWRFFVVEQPTMGHYTQVMGWLNAKDQYIPPAAAMDWRWDQYYNGPMTQYREMQRLYAELEAQDQADQRIFMLAATIFFYDQTVQIVDLFDDIPWTEAGKLRETADLTQSLPVYDNGQDIYTAILDDLKSIADELANISVPEYNAGLFAKQDYLNDGDIELWQKYCNSLRLRMLIRASAVMTARAQSEIPEILTNPATYPIVTGNDDDIMLDAGGPNLYATTTSQSGGIQQAMLTWGQYDIAPKAMVDHMVTNADPRLEITFDTTEVGTYVGMDPLNDATTQNQNLVDNMISRYDESTFVRNDYFPGFVITAAEVSFLKAEAFHKGYASGDAEEAYETGVRQSIEMYYEINSTGDFRDPIPMPDPSVIDAYLLGANVNWAAAADKMVVLADQKWINTGLGQMPQTWAEYRRLDLPVFEFADDPTSAQAVPPVRWLYPESEKQLNGDNYSAVQSKDELNTKIFWDVN
jgi:hypothetical protein